MMFNYGWHMQSSWAWVSFLVMAIVWVALLALVLLGLTRAFSHPSQSSSHRSPEDQASSVLRERFARGEISEAEYRQSIRVLGETTH